MTAGAGSLVLPAALIPQATLKFEREPFLSGPTDCSVANDDAEPIISEIIALLHARSGNDFKPYKQGALRRRIERRTAMAGLKTPGGYLAALRADAAELDLLAKDLLINVTSFFRDPKSFEFLATDLIPAIVRDHRTDQSLRVWVAGCSSGEEAYSLNKPRN